MRSTKVVQRVLYAADRGYRVDVDGDVLSPSGRRLKLDANSYGYLRFYVRNRRRGLRGSVPVHMLAAYQWHGVGALEEGIQVRHRDGDQSNNARSNILIGTGSENMMDVDANVRRRVSAAGLEARRRMGLALTVDQEIEMRADRASGLTYSELMRKHGVARATVWRALKGE